MKIDRLIGILSILLQKEMTTAPELADHFEVSRRTINRDIEALCKAGIPIQTSQGAGGGISIMNGYRMEDAFDITGYANDSCGPPKFGQCKWEQILWSVDGKDPGRFFGICKWQGFHPN